MGTDVVIICNQTQQEDKELQFLDILLDETLIFGTVYVPAACYQKAGTINRRLPSKQVYEYALRLVCGGSVWLSQKAPENIPEYLIFNNPVRKTGTEQGLQTDCYVAARYKKELLEYNLFDVVIESILDAASECGCRQRVIPFLEKMLRGGNTYQYFYQGSQPFLIYRGSSECYQVLDTFAQCFGSTLRESGFLVEYFDPEKEGHTALSRYIGKSFQAVVGIQTFLFSARMENGDYVHDHISGPKYNFVFDHPLWMYHQFKNVPDNLVVLTLDKGYAAYIRRYSKLNARFLPPGGIQQPYERQTRIYDVVFIGTFIDNTIDIFRKLRHKERPMRFLINRMWLIMRKNPCLPVEDALRGALEHYNYALLDQQFAALCYELREYILYLSQYRRRKLIKMLVCSGIRVDVFGTSWKYSELRYNPNFIWHNKDLGTQECLDIWWQSKIALNVMTCHTNAITERIANSMLQKAAVCTERNPYLESQFLDGQDILFYDLAHLSELPERIAGLLKDEKKLEQIGENGCKKAEQWHTWGCRAKEFLKNVDDDARKMMQTDRTDTSGKSGEI